VTTKKLVAVVGATGTGKSDLALELCEHFGGEVVNCDSLQVYRYFDIGTAKLPLEERRGIPHHLIDILDPDEMFTAGEYARRARAILDDLAATSRVPVVAGGTGFYLKALIDGLFTGPVRDGGLRQRLAGREQRRPGSLHRLLARLDPAAGRSIHANDIPKVIRALEVRILTRRPITELFLTGRDSLEGFTTLKIGLDPSRDPLYDRLNSRCVRMFEAGLVDEVRQIHEMGYSYSLKPFESHGYRQALQVLKGELKVKEAIFYAQRNTRHYAKRQMTWFRRDPEVVWLPGFGESETLRQRAKEQVARFLECGASPVT